jgi:hypothetical protein
VFIQDGHPIALKSKNLCGAHLRWPIHEKNMYVMVCSLKTWGHYLGTYKTKVFTDNVSLHYFETQLKAPTKQLDGMILWHY